MIDPRGVPTASCPNCGCDLIWIVATFDEDTYEVSGYLLDNAKCFHCDTPLTAPCNEDAISRGIPGSNTSY